MLTDLAVYFGQGLPVDLHMLSMCHWPLLESLTLHSGRLDDAQAAVIFRADWPLLWSLRLPYNCLMHLEDVDHSRWPQLQSICLMDNPVSNTAWTPLIWHQLIEANWPMLFSLDLHGSRIEATMMKDIVEDGFSSIRTLNLSNNSLDSEAIGHLVKGPWLQLCDLQFHSALCGSIADCLGLLSAGVWLQLKYLELGANGVDVTALSALARSKWPSLYFLCLPHNGLLMDDFKLMGGGAACDEPRDILDMQEILAQAV